MPAENRPASLLRARYRRLPRRAAAVWQGGLVRMPLWLDSPEEGPPIRPWGAMWVAGPDGLVHVEIAEGADPPPPSFAADALVQLALRYQDRLAGRPGTIQVLTAELGRAIAAELGDVDVAVDVVPELDAVTDALRSFAAHDQDGPEIPALLDEHGMTVDDVRRFADAARRFYLAEPWQHLTDEDLIEIERPKGDGRARCCVVLGNGGMEFGLGFYASADDYADMADSPAGFPERRQFWSVSFDRPDIMPFADHDLWIDHRLPLVDESHYPVAIGYGPDAEVSRPTRQLLAHFEAVLSALADTTEAEIDAGRWKKSVPGPGGAVAVHLALPNVLDPEDLDTVDRPIHDPRTNERLQAEIAAFLSDGNFASTDEANEALQKKFAGRRTPTLASAASTPVERAQDIAYRAFDAIGRRRVILAQEALAVSPDCADAYVVLAEQAAEPARALQLYEQGVEAGRRALGDETFGRDAGRFWDILETRPYMRARLGVARTLVELGRDDEAMPHFLDLIRLNPNDSQGVRYLLLLQYLQAGLDDQASALIQRYKDDPTAEWTYTRALLSLRAGDRARAAADLEQARRANAFVPDYLLDPEAEAPDDHPEGVTIGGRDEAAEYADVYGEVWQDTRGALEWLQRQERGRAKSRRGKARRGKGSGSRRTGRKRGGR